MEQRSITGKGFGKSYGKGCLAQPEPKLETKPESVKVQGPSSKLPPSNGRNDEVAKRDGKATGSQQRKGRRGRVGVEYGKAESIDHAREEKKNLQKPRRRSGLKPEVTVKRKAKPGIIVAKETKTEARPEITVKRDTVVK